MLNESLVKLGINEPKARKAAEQNAKLDMIHGLVFELTRQTACMNDRLINVEKRMDRFEQRIIRVKNDIGEIKAQMSGMMDMLKILVDRQT